MLQRSPKQPSVMKHKFSEVPKAEIPRSVFNRSHAYKTMFDAGYLIPFLVDEVLPGDTFKVDATLFARLSTPIVPFMDNLFLDTFFFFVPNRLLWTNFQRFMGEQDPDPGSSTAYTVPQHEFNNIAVDTLHDYFGMPCAIAQDFSVNALPFRAYNLIWNQWFRDQNLQDSVTVDIDDGPDASADYVLLRRGKRHDYFTSCLPWPQKGDAVDIGLTGDAPIKGIGISTGYVSGVAGPHNVTETARGASTPYANYQQFDAYSKWEMSTSGASALPMAYADLSGVSAVNINDLREAFQLQKLLERDARGGTRYTEIVKAHFNVTSPDARLQRPEYLGGGTAPIMINPVPQTSETSGTELGTLAAYGTVLSRNQGFTKSFTEHGILIGLCMARADLTYQQGIERFWSRSTKYDYFWPALAHIGEQSVLNKEIYAKGVAADDNVFGYQERYAEYRYKPSRITSRLRSEHATSLDYWHLSQEFGSLPVLDDTFIQENPPVDRVIAVPAEPHFVMDSYINYVTVRPMPVYGVPGLIDHF